jgi:hypothetical protein
LVEAARVARPFDRAGYRGDAVGCGHSCGRRQVKTEHIGTAILGGLDHHPPLPHPGLVPAESSCRVGLDDQLAQPRPQLAGGQGRCHWKYHGGDTTRHAKLELGHRITDHPRLGQVKVTPGKGGVHIGQAAHDIHGQVELSGGGLTSPGQCGSDLHWGELRDRRRVGHRDQFAEHDGLPLRNLTPTGHQIVDDIGTAAHRSPRFD